MHSIQIFTADATHLDVLRVAKLPQGASFATRDEARPDAINFDFPSLDLIIQVSRDILIAAIPAIATVWAAQMAAHPKAADVEIVTIYATITLPIDVALESRLQERLPENVKTVMSLRFMRQRR